MERVMKVRMEMRSLSEKVKEHYALPPDAVYQGCEYDAKRDTVTMKFKHQTFDMVKEPEITKPPETASTEEKKTEDSGPKGSEEISKGAKNKKWGSE